jgi:hypothetical protein
MPDDSETIALRSTIIGGNGYPDDYQVIWRGLPVGRIMKGTGSPNYVSQWWWGCTVYGQPQLGGDSGTGADLEDCKAQFKTAWVRVRAGLTDEDIATAHDIAEASSEALARYDRKRG